MNIFKTFYMMLSSRVFLLWLTGGWITYYVISAVWMKEAFGSFMGNLHGMLMFKILFVFFLIGGYLNFIRSSIETFKQSRIQLIAGFLLPLGILIFFTGYFMSATMREAGQRVVSEGDFADPPWMSEKYYISKIDPGLKDRLVDRDIEEGIFSYEPTLSVIDNESRNYSIGAYPPSKIHNTYFHILNFGISPGLRFFENSTLRQEGYIPMNIIVPGSSDFFEIPPLPYRFTVSMEPEQTYLKGAVKVSQFDLREPVFRVIVYRGEELVAEGDSRRGVHFDNFKIQLFRPKYWVLLEAVKDAGVPLIQTGIVMVLAGAPLSLGLFLFRLYRREYSGRYQ